MTDATGGPPVRATPRVRPVRVAQPCLHVVAWFKWRHDVTPRHVGLRKTLVDKRRRYLELVRVPLVAPR